MGVWFRHEFYRVGVVPVGFKDPLGPRTSDRRIGIDEHPRRARLFVEPGDADPVIEQRQSVR